MIYFNKMFKMPGPKDLGWSDSNNAMPSKLFPNNKTEKTWEDYYDYLKKTYPVKFFFSSTLPEFFVDHWRDLSRPFKDAHYWVVSHTTRRYHILDLRQPKNGANNIDCYRYGWCDTDHKIVYAMFNLLCDFVENEAPGGYYVPSEEDAAKDDANEDPYKCGGLRRQLDNYKEFTAIYNWWKKDRFVEDEEYSKKLREWSDARHKFADNTDALWAELNALEARNDAKLEEMLIRLIRIRRCMWT